MAKQTTKKDASHYFIDGYPASADMVGVLGYPNALKGTDAEYSTFYMADSSEWTHEKLSFDTRGVIQTRQGSNWTWWILGKRGQVFSMSATSDATEQIADAGTGPGRHGYANKIALIADALDLPRYGGHSNYAAISFTLLFIKFNSYSMGLT